MYLFNSLWLIEIISTWPKSITFKNIIVTACKGLQSELNYWEIDEPNMDLYCEEKLCQKQQAINTDRISSWVWCCTRSHGTPTVPLPWLSLSSAWRCPQDTTDASSTSLPSRSCLSGHGAGKSRPVLAASHRLIRSESRKHWPPWALQLIKKRIKQLIQLVQTTNSINSNN